MRIRELPLHDCEVLDHLILACNRFVSLRSSPISEQWRLVVEAKAGSRAS